MRNPTVFFYLPENDDVYFDAPVVLAEGLRELGVPYVANRDYWQISADSPATLFQRAAGMTHHDADIVVIHDDWFYHYPQSTLRIEERPAPPGLLTEKRGYRLVYLDTWVGARSNSWTPEFRYCDLILRTHLNSRASRPSNMRPWVLGFTSRIIRACEPTKPFAARRRAVAENFSYTHPFSHGVRELFERRVAPGLSRSFEFDRTRSKPEPQAMSAQDRLMWRQTVDKHNPDYFCRLGSSMAVATFCGYLVPGLPADASVHFRGEKRYQALSMIFRAASAATFRTPRLIQWDSWRFWETLCAGSVALHLDLEKYGAALPVMPENGKHYLGVDLDRSQEFAAAVDSDSDALERVGVAGRRWALEHYSPQAMAARFLAMLGYAAEAN